MLSSPLFSQLAASSSLISLVEPRESAVELPVQEYLMSMFGEPRGTCESKRGCRIVGSIYHMLIDHMHTEADNQYSSHCAMMSRDSRLLAESLSTFRQRLKTTQQTQARGTRMGCRRAARVTPRRAVAGFDAGIHTGPVSFIPVNTLCRVFH